MLSCKTTILPERTYPHYSGIDARITPYLNDYAKLALRHNVFFTKYVSIGFANINAKSGSHSVIGVCYSGNGWREIEIDIKSWERATETSRKSLFRHEATHCFCNRDHDFGDGQGYRDPSTEDMISFIHRSPFNILEKGLFEDGCPMSLMYPRIISDYCAKAHESEYVGDMFNRCDAW